MTGNRGKNTGRPGNTGGTRKRGRRASRELFSGARSYDTFIREIIESEPGTVPGTPGAGSRARAAADTEETARRLIGATNWSRLKPRLRRELMSRLRGVHEQIDDATDRTEDALEAARKRIIDALEGLPDSPPKPGKGKLGKGGQKKPVPPKKPGVQKPKLPKKPPKPGRGVPGKGTSGTEPRPPKPPPLPRFPVPAPWPSEPEPPRPQAERRTESRVGYFVSVSSVGYYTDSPPVADQSTITFDFDDDPTRYPDGLLRLRAGESWVSDWHTGEILRGMNLDVSGDYRVNFLDNGDFSL